MRAAARTSSDSGQRKQDSLREWRQIIDLLEAGDVLLATHALQTHLIGSYRSYLSFFDAEGMQNNAEDSGSAKYFLR